MRANVNITGCHAADVLLDGEKLSHCIEADEDEGWARCMVRNEAGQPIFDPDDEHGDGVRTELRHGKVEVVFNPPEWRQVAEIAIALDRIAIPGIKRLYVGWERG